MGSPTPPGPQACWHKQVFKALQKADRIGASLKADAKQKRLSVLNCIHCIIVDTYKCPLADADWTSDSKFCLIFQTEISLSLEPLDFKLLKIYSFF